MRTKTNHFYAFFLAGILIAGLAQAAIPTQSSEAIAASESAFLLRAGAVVDPDAGHIYVMNNEGGIDAMSLDGEVIWSSKTVARPLGMYGNFVITQQGTSPAGELSLEFIDRSSGERVGETNLLLAEQVSASIAEGPHTVFHAQTRLENGSVLVDWKFTKMHSGAMLARDEMLQAPAKSAVSTAPKTIGGTVSYDPVSGTQKQISNTPREYASAAKTQLLAKEFIPGALQAMYSVDDRHVLVTERVAPGTLSEYRWSVFDAQAQNEIGYVPSRQGGASFFVNGNTIVFASSPHTRFDNESSEEHGLELMAMNLETHELTWVKEIRDTKFYGPYPH